MVDKPSPKRQPQEVPAARQDTTPKKASGMKRLSQAALLYFGGCTTALLGGTGVEFYADHQKATSLSADYARAAACEAKKDVAQCNIHELQSVARVEANESMREGGDTAQTVGVVGLVLGVLAN